jgi:hypothetical protein
MSSQTDPPSTPPIQQFESPYAALARKLTLLVLLTLAVALGLTILSQYYWARSPVMTFLLANFVIALVAGFSVRWVFRKQIALVRTLLALAVLTAGLALLGFLSGGRIGIGPWRPGASWFDWLDFVQLFMGMDTFLLCLFAWQFSIPLSAPSPQEESLVQPASTRKRLAKHPRRTTASSATGAQPDQIVPAASTSADTQPVKPKRKRLLRRKPQLQLSDVQEHRCPYCLELIEPDDPRGVVECKICHTLHHADCWAITGACQVPHYNS